MVGGAMFWTPGEWMFMLVLVAALGYGVLRGCEAGCSYARDRIELKWKGGE